MVTKTYYGWITVDKTIYDLFGHNATEKALEDRGVKLGTWDSADLTWSGCEVSSDTLNKLDPLWGILIWGLATNRELA